MPFFSFLSPCSGSLTLPIRSDIGLSRSADVRTRSIYVRNLPPATQEGLLQQEFEKIARVKRVEVFLDRREAVVELQNQAVS